MKAGAYSESRQHVEDECRRLDLRLQHLLIRQPDAQESTTPGAPDGHALDQEGRRLEAEIATRRTASLAAGVPLALPQLARQFHLTPFEEQCVLACLAPEVDSHFETLYAQAHGDALRRGPSVELLLSLFCATPGARVAALESFCAQGPLLNYRLCQLTSAVQDDSGTLLSRSLKLDERIVDHLLGSRRVDTRLDTVAELVAPTNASAQPTAAEDVRRRAVRLIETHFEGGSRASQNVLINFHGPAGCGKRSLAEGIARDLRLPLLVGDVRKMLEGPLPIDECFWLLAREALLHRSAQCLNHADAFVLNPDQHHRALDRLVDGARTFARVTFVLTDRAWSPQRLPSELLYISQALESPSPAVSRQLWASQLPGSERLAGDVDCGTLASRFPLGPGQIHRAIAVAAGHAAWRAQDARIDMSDLCAASRALSNPRLGTLARKLEPRCSWSDLVLPPDQLTLLADLCDQVLYRDVVHGAWRFERKLSRGKGLAALFSGPSGTGKTMAAEVIAHQLELDLYQIDLSQVVSKYIGESEKNLHRIFTEAEASNAILFFDEADALFGKRADIKDAHDRYANIEVGYLLQKIEEYQGIAILATNLRHHLDDAFVRRMQVIVEFPFPDETHRLRLWRGMFPREAPVAPDVDFGLLARDVKLAGGNLKNVVMAAAFYAARDGGVVTMPHLLEAARREYQKLGRTWGEGVERREVEPCSAI